MISSHVKKNGLTSEQEQELLKEAKQLKEDLKKGKVKIYKNAEEMTKDI